MNLRIVHLSDLHISKTTEYDFDHYIVKPLIKDLLKFNDKNNIDLILITGDLIDKGGSSFENLEEGFQYIAQQLFTKILKSLKLKKSNIFFVPGNHDIDRSADSVLTEKGALTSLNSEKCVIDFMEKANFDNCEAIERNLAFKNFEKEFYSDSKINKKITIFESSYSIKIKNRKIGVACINSSWRSFSDEDKEKLIIGERQLSHCLDEIENCNIKLLLSHHSTDYLMDFEKKNIDNLITENFHIATFGHNHSPEYWVKSVMRGRLFTSVGRSNWSQNIRNSNTDIKNGYSIIDYNEDLNSITQNFRIYSHNQKEYVSDTDFAGDNGSITHYFKNEISKILILHGIGKHIEDNFMSIVNEDLLTHGTDTNAPDDVNEIFVEPNIVYRTEDEKEKEKEVKDVTISINEICELKDNVIIFGPKEMGKTVLMDKILITYLELINEYQTIPVLINFMEFNHSRVETGVSQFTGIKITKIERTLSSL